MLKYIVVRDITRFLVMYVFVLLGFGFAFHALFQLSPAIAGSVGSATLGSVGSSERSDRNHRISWTQIARLDVIGPELSIGPFCVTPSNPTQPIS